jgi:hypothetical protein
MRLEQEEQPVTCGIGERRQVVENGGAFSQSVNPDGRIREDSRSVKSL